MNFKAALILGLLPLSVLAADLKVAPGQTYIVKTSDTDMVLDSLVLGDAARVEFESGVASWRVQAKRVVIGDRVVIDGRGRPGESGVSGVSAEGCERGQLNGQAGSHGAPGTDGVSMRLQWGLEKLGSLQIFANGGRGGDGGSGGDGADNSDDCAGERGGDGGNGGVGGVGGSAGDITVLYQILSDTLQPIDVAQRIKVEVKAGQGGEGGRGGSGGEGSGGHYVTQKTLTGNRKWVSGGETGLSGSPGQSGESGATGSLMMDSLMVQAPAPTVTKQAAPSNKVEALLRRIQDLERRVEALESVR